ncbi:NADP-dependent malic enzyme, partial [Candidatus Peregrinibacteria bacterium]|nr:NADP-dependent malic enzyme [Candidatus Peregrinibacteria bacterium]
MSKFDEAALELHRVNKGKLGVAAKVPVKNRDDLSKAYTPGVAAVSRAIAEDKSLMYEYTGKGNMVAVVSDGSAVLGLGNIGPEAAYPVMEGKSLLFKEFAGVEAFPIVLDTQNSDEIVRIVCALAPGFGGINLEDIAAPRCFEIEAELKRRLKIPIFHDDQHGTAIVVLAGLINALKVVGKNKSVKIVINGAGSAGMAITDLLHAYGFSNLTVVDSRGAIYLGREGLNAKKAAVAEFSN